MNPGGATPQDGRRAGRDGGRGGAAPDLPWPASNCRLPGPPYRAYLRIALSSALVWLVRRLAAALPQHLLIRGAAHPWTRPHLTPTHVTLLSSGNAPLPRCVHFPAPRLVLPEPHNPSPSNPTTPQVPHLTPKTPSNPVEEPVGERWAGKQGGWVVLGVARPIRRQAEGAAAAPISQAQQVV